MTEKEIKDDEIIAGSIMCIIFAFVLIFFVCGVIFGVAELDLWMIVSVVTIFSMLVYFANDVRKKLKS